MAEQKENEGVIIGTIDAPVDVQFTAAGKAKGRLKLKRTETWDGGSKDVFLTFSLWGKVAEDMNTKNPSIGTAVRVTYKLGSWEAKNKAGEMLGFHNPDLKAWRVDIRSEQAGSQPQPAEDIPF